MKEAGIKIHSFTAILNARYLETEIKVKLFNCGQIQMQSTEATDKVLQINKLQLGFNLEYFSIEN